MSAALLFISLVAAAEIQPDLELRGAVSYQRIGFQGEARGGAKLSLWNQDNSVLFGDTYLKAHATAQVTPAYLRAGGRLTFEPIAVFNLAAFGYYSYYFGNFQTVISFDDPAANYGSNNDLKAYAARQTPGSGFTWGVSPTIKAKAGPAVIAINAEYTNWHTHVDSALGDYFFEREYELLIGFQDQVINANGVLLYHMDRDPNDGRYLRVGDITTYRHALGDTKDTLLRTGLLVSLSTNDERWTHSLVVQPYLVSRAFPKAFPPFVAYTVKWVL